MSMLPRRNLSEYEKWQEKKAREDLDSFWYNDWGRDHTTRSSTTTSSTTTKSSYDIWLKDREAIWIEERNRLISIDRIQPFEDPNSFKKSSESTKKKVTSPPVWVLLWRWLIRFFKRFHKWNRYTGFFR